MELVDDDILYSCLDKGARGEFPRPVPSGYISGKEGGGLIQLISSFTYLSAYSQPPDGVIHINCLIFFYIYL
jgi:hypothetical protein